MFNITRQTIEQFTKHANQQYPLEACGLLIVGKNVQNNGEVIDGFVPITNISPNPTHQFEFDPKQFIKTIHQLETNQCEWLGVIHSHPTTSAIPSDLDINNWHYSSKSYWVYSLLDNQLRAFHIIGKQVTSKDFEVI